MHSVFFPALQGPGTKMSASIPNSAIFLTDTPSQIKNKINKHAFSGGGDTAALHAENGGNCDVDVAFAYLSFFLDNDAELDEVRAAYSDGSLGTSELKKRCVEVLQGVVAEVQEARKKVGEKEIEMFMTPRERSVKFG
jgi:tryptophanyl-tRNA synthetase